MQTTQRGAAPTNALPLVREIVVAAQETALNAALERHEVSPERIISVMLEPGTTLAIGDHGPRYRVLYRA